MAYTKEQIVEMLGKNDKAICRALVVLYNNQTSEEQQTESTRVNNGKGFSGPDARIGTSMAKFYMSRGFLTNQQLSYWRRPSKKGTMKIAKYVRQLLEAIPAQQKELI